MKSFHQKKPLTALKSDVCQVLEEKQEQKAFGAKCKTHKETLNEDKYVKTDIILQNVMILFLKSYLVQY